MPDVLSRDVCYILHSTPFFAYTAPFLLRQVDTPFQENYNPKYAFLTFSFERRFSEESERVIRPFSIT